MEVRRGSGTFVLDRTMVPDIGLQRLENLRTRLRDLFEIRMMIEPQAARPVSYTHLDVYKRQSICWTRPGSAAFELF